MGVLSRFIFHKRDFTGPRAKPGAFLPQPKVLKTSAFWIDDLSPDEIWHIGDEVAGKPRGLASIARADLESTCLPNLKLHVEPDPTPHPRHVDICGWPAEKAEQKAIALELCHSATLKVR